MMPPDAQPLAERLSGALARVLSDTTGISFESGELVLGTQSDVLAGLSSDALVHVELELLVGRNPAYPLVLAGAKEQLLPVFELIGMKGASVATDTDGQLALLTALSECAETLASGLAAALSARGAPVSARVSGTAIENADESQPPAAVLHGDVTAFHVSLARTVGEPLSLAVIVPAELASVLNSSAAEPPASTRSAVYQQDPETITVPLASREAVNAGGAASRPVAHPYMFGQLEPEGNVSAEARSIEPILDVPLQVRVELGSTEMLVEEVLAIGIGSIIELDRMAGEPVDVVVNNRLIAHGEVVVVEESFGVRITEIVRQRGRSAAG